MDLVRLGHLNEKRARASAPPVAPPWSVRVPSVIGDFGDDERVAEIRSNIRVHFGVTVDGPEPVFIADVLERIRGRHEA
jgi:hypothetical protein